MRPKETKTPKKGGAAKKKGKDAVRSRVAEVKRVNRRAVASVKARMADGGAEEMADLVTPATPKDKRTLTKRASAKLRKVASMAGMDSKPKRLVDSPSVKATKSPNKVKRLQGKRSTVNGTPSSSSGSPSKRSTRRSARGTDAVDGMEVEEGVEAFTLNGTSSSKQQQQQPRAGGGLLSRTFSSIWPSRRGSYESIGENGGEQQGNKGVVNGGPPVASTSNGCVIS